MPYSPERPPDAVYTVNGFCVSHKISRSHLYNLWKEGRGPRVMRGTGRKNISFEAAADWRREMEEEPVI